jgi:hypothetical protein
MAALSVWSSSAGCSSRLDMTDVFWDLMCDNDFFCSNSLLLSSGAVSIAGIESWDIQKFALSSHVIEAARYHRYQNCINQSNPIQSNPMRFVEHAIP